MYHSRIANLYKQQTLPKKNNNNKKENNKIIKSNMKLNEVRIKIKSLKTDPENACTQRR